MDSLFYFRFQFIYRIFPSAYDILHKSLILKQIIKTTTCLLLSIMYNSFRKIHHNKNTPSCSINSGRTKTFFIFFFVFSSMVPLYRHPHLGLAPGVCLFVFWSIFPFVEWYNVRRPYSWLNARCCFLLFQNLASYIFLFLAQMLRYFYKIRFYCHEILRFHSPNSKNRLYYLKNSLIKAKNYLTYN